MLGGGVPVKKYSLLFLPLLNTRLRFMDNGHFRGGGVEMFLRVLSENAKRTCCCSSSKTVMGEFSHW